VEDKMFNKDMKYLPSPWEKDKRMRPQIVWAKFNIGIR
jgi:hypothetical protein